MASQQVLFTETIIAMKKAKKRKAYGKPSKTCRKYILPLLSLPNIRLAQNPIPTPRSNLMVTAVRN